MFTIFETVVASVQAVAVAEHDAAPVNEDGRGQPANYCTIA
uniref:Mating factor a3.1 n=1 Tax=Anthracocystis walkeri TaxID=1134040 RepID=H2CZ56_9BASI|nr:mating factor a3.1 [Anthracocystis walkeri]